MAEKNNFYLIVDEVYEDFIYDKEKTSYMSAQMWPNTIVIKSFSKKYSLTGWRFGYAICGDSIIASKMINIKSNTIGPPNSLIQKAVEYNWDNIIDNRIVDYKARRDYLAESCGWKAPDAGLYFCVPVKHLKNWQNMIFIFSLERIIICRVMRGFHLQTPHSTT